MSTLRSSGCATLYQRARALEASVGVSHVRRVGRSGMPAAQVGASLLESWRVKCVWFTLGIVENKRETNAV